MKYVLFLQLASFSLVSAETILEKLMKIKTCGPPQIHNNMMNLTVRPGQQASFKCQIDMSCIVAFIEWYHDMPNGTATKIKTARSGDPHTHIIQNVEPNHEGTYTCVAGNVMGKAEASAYLQVYSGSSVTSKTSSGGLLLLVMLMKLLTCIGTQPLYTG